MFEKIVVAVDGSHATEGVVGVVIGLATKLGSEVEVVHVHEHDPTPSKATMAAVTDLETPSEAQQLLNGALDRLKAAGITAHGTLIEAHTREVPQRIIATAGDAGADMIVVGRRGLSNLSEMLVGSVSNKLMHLSPIPVLVIHEAKHPSTA
jgi:nucleotide-binding universal stress UspA family protein